MQLLLHNMQFLETYDEAVDLHGVKKAETHQPALQGGRGDATDHGEKWPALPR